MIQLQMTHTFMGNPLLSILLVSPTWPEFLHLTLDYDADNSAAEMVGGSQWAAAYRKAKALVAQMNLEEKVS